MTLLELEKDFVILWLYGLIIKIRYRLSDHCHMIILSDDDPEMDFYALWHLSDYYKRFYLKRAVIVSKKMKKLPDYKVLDNLVIKLINMNDRKIDKLKKVSRMHGFYIKTISLNIPEEKMLKNLPGVKGISKEDILCVAEYQLFRYEKVPYEY